MASLGDEDVGGLDVAMDNAGSVCCIESVGYLDRERKQSFDF